MSPDNALSRCQTSRADPELYACNTASARVLDRLGMRHEAHLVSNEYVKGEWCDEDDYALLADEWRASRSKA